MILISTATQTEAKPIIDYFKLKQVCKTPFSIYESEKLFLIITNIGKLACISAISYFFGRVKNEKIIGAINIGIAGHRSLSIGDIILAHKVLDNDTNKTTYPSMALKWKGKTDELTTFSNPLLDYSTNTLIDMEGAGFFFACLNFLNIDVVHSLKIISDNQQNPIHNLDKNKVIHLIEKNIPTIQQLIDKIFKLNSLLTSENKIEIDKIIENVHFTETEKIKLAELLERTMLLDVKYNINELLEQKSAKKIINSLKSLIENGYNLH